MVNVWESVGAEQEAQAYCERWDLQGTILLDETSEVARALGIRGVPTNVFVDTRGFVRGVGATTSEELLAGAVELAPELGGDEDALNADRMPSGFGDGVQ